MNDREAPRSLRQSGTQRACCMDQEARWTVLDLLQPDSTTVFDRRIDRRAAPTVPKAVADLPVYLCNRRGEGPVDPRLVLGHS